jgi:hypothetical protein
MILYFSIIDQRVIMKERPKFLTVIAVICAILFGITLTLALFAYNIEQQLFNPEVYKQAFAEQNVCARLPAVLTQQITSSINSQDQSGLIGLLIGSMKPDKLQGLIELVLPCQVIEKVVYEGIDQIFSAINGATAQNGISLTLIKQSIGENSAAALDEFLKSQPDCTTVQLLEIGAIALFGQSDKSKMVLCNPPDTLQELFTIPLGLMVDAAIQGLPDQVTIASGLVDLVTTIRMARVIMNLSPLLPLLFLGLTAGFAMNARRNLLRWWGIPLLVSGLVALVISLVISPMIYSMLIFLILPRLSGNLVPTAVQLISDVFSTVAQGIVKPIQYQSAVISLVGLVMVIGEWLSKPKK